MTIISVDKKYLLTKREVRRLWHLFNVGFIPCTEKHITIKEEKILREKLRNLTVKL